MRAYMIGQQGYGIGHQPSQAEVQTTHSPAPLSWCSASTRPASAINRARTVGSTVDWSVRASMPSRILSRTSSSGCHCSATTAHYGAMSGSSRAGGSTGGGKSAVNVLLTVSPSFGGEDVQRVPGDHHGE